MIILGCANSYQEAKRRTELVRERQGISRLFRRGPLDHPVEVFEESPHAGQFIFDQLRAQHFRNRDSVLHLTGYSRGEFTHLQGGLGEEAFTAQQVATLASRLPALKLVFLNGCATPELVRHLLRRDIPAVIATQTEHQRMQYSALAYSFYDGLRQGKTIYQAFAPLHRATPEMVDLYPVDYDLYQDEFVVEGRSFQAMAGQTLPGGLYFQSDRQAELNWHIPPRTERKAAG